MFWNFTNVSTNKCTQKIKMQLIGRFGLGQYTFKEIFNEKNQKFQGIWKIMLFHNIETNLFWRRNGTWIFLYIFSLPIFWFFFLRFSIGKNCLKIYNFKTCTGIMPSSFYSTIFFKVTLTKCCDCYFCLNFDSHCIFYILFKL